MAILPAPALLRRWPAITVLLLVAAALPARGAEEPAPAAGSDDPAAPSEGESEELSALRREVRELRELVLALQDQVRSLSEKAEAAPPAPPVPPPAPPAPLPAATTNRLNIMNPSISALFLGIGNTSIVRGEQDNGFDLSEAEIAFQSVVDPYARVDLYLAFPDAETPEVEEGAVSTLALPASMQLKGGRFKSAFGKWNRLHSHAYFTVDRPDALDLYFGEESFTNDGLSLSVLVPNPWDLYIESVTEAGTAREGSSFNSSGRAMTWLQHLSAFFNIGDSSTLEVGVTASRGSTGPAESLLDDLSSPGVPASLQPVERMASAVQGIDLTFKWRPPRTKQYRSFLWQTELLRSRRELERLSPALTLERGAVTSLGGYSYAEMQLAKRWKAGLRADVSGLPQDERARVWAASGVLKFQPSEFQELRFQVRRSRHDRNAAMLLDEERDDTRLLFEWIPIIGAHGAHKY